MEIENDTDFEICDTCPSLHNCESSRCCKIQEMVMEDVETLNAWLDDHTVVRERGDK